MGFKNSRGPISEINVTPLVDVMLVLLVIFMITAPLMHSAIQLKLPKTKKVSSIKLSKEQLILSVSADLEYFIGDQKVFKDDLVDQVLKRIESLEKKVLYIRADYSIKYGEVAKLMANLKKEGISNIALVTENSNDS